MKIPEIYGKGRLPISYEIFPPKGELGIETLQDMAQALDLIRMAWKNGTRTIMLTPHYRGKYKENTPQWLREVYELLCLTVAEELPDMKLYLGHEIFCQTDAPDRLAAGRILSLNDSHYALLEFHTGFLRSKIVQGVSETVLHGFTPIIAHAERYEVFRKDRTLLEEVRSMGALIQLNADSVMGAHGLAVKQYCHSLLKNREAHFIASDAHDTAHRPPLLRECFLRVHKKYGSEYAAQVFYENAKAVIEKQMV